MSTPLPFSSPPLWISVFGLGKLRPAPGTWGSMPPVVLAGALWLAGLGPTAAPVVYHVALVAVLLVFSAACILQGDHAEAYYKRKDPSNAVADETAGQCFSLMLLPAGAVYDWRIAAVTFAAAFVLFRIFDIIKPWPAHSLQRLPAGWGILIDDLIAGLYAMLVVQGLVRWGYPALGWVPGP